MSILTWNTLIFTISLLRDNIRKILLQQVDYWRDGKHFTMHQKSCWSCWTQSAIQFVNERAKCRPTWKRIQFHGRAPKISQKWGNASNERDPFKAKDKIILRKFSDQFILYGMKINTINKEAKKMSLYYVLLCLFEMLSYLFSYYSRDTAFDSLVRLW